ncbi:MTH938/NDUFAF3 family protein [Microvirga sp. W0021]|uniref:MTH938/NDUFAF3 family protein n=1 Tax=Hohaiivirga grylli TaxID=3133970 RepID=A0ABV0BL38_9HYPH
MSDGQQIYDGFIPGRYPIDAYGDGGFRFAEMSHRGSIVILPSGIHAWRRDETAAVSRESLEQDFNLILDIIRQEAHEIDFLFVGTGNNVVLPTNTLKQKLIESGIRSDFMQTGSALRTYNSLFEEQRRIAMAVIAVQN